METTRTGGVIARLKADHSCTEFYTLKVSKRFSVYLSAVFISLGWKPNSITYLMLLVGLLATPLIASPLLTLNLAGCLLLILTNVLDTCDGEVARLTGQCSKFGVLLDKICHFITHAFLYMALGIHFHTATQSLWPLAGGFLLVVVTSLDEISKEIYMSLDPPDPSRPRKESRRKLSIEKNHRIQFLVHVTSGSTAFYHLYGLFLLSDVAMANLGIPAATGGASLAYAAYYLLANCLKAFVRLKRIQTLLRATS